MKKILWFTLSIALIGVLLFFMMNRGSSRIPAKLLGMWITNTAGYEDRYLILQDENIVLGTGGNSSDLYHVNRVREENNGSNFSYIINYENDEKTKFKLKFVYTTGRNETIKIYPMKDIVWTKKNKLGKQP